MSDFIERLAKLLRNTEHVSKEEAEEACSRIHSHMLATRGFGEGPCLNCERHIAYSGRCTTHQRMGDEWLEGLREKWVSPPKVASDSWGRRVTYNGYSWRSVEHYLCSDCRAVIYELEELAAEEARERAREAADEERERENLILQGEIRATPAKRFWILRGRMSREMESELASMPYRKFLGTIYWDVVRNYVLYKKDRACELCNKTTSLQVHHRTYEHRGSEYNHLEDLVCLCSGCHAKFHDKLPGGVE